jgi:SAM-dependent methyltransferase
MASDACRSCGAPLEQLFVDLGMSPLCESFLSAGELDRMEPFYPLRVLVCGKCWLVQLGEYVRAESIFSDYAYFSSYSDSWLAHAKAYVDMITERFGLGPKNRVVELASNDGYLLQYFVAKGIPSLGVEPAANVAKVAVEKGVPTVVKFFGRKTAGELLAEGGPADVIVGNNVLAQVPDLNDFVGGMKVLLAPTGVVTMEFPHLMKLIEGTQFDTIYHEHFSYFSWIATQRIFASHGLTLFDVEELPSHGGSLRIFARHAEDAGKPVTARAREIEASERAAGVARPEYYEEFARRVVTTKHRLLDFLIDAKGRGKSIVGYGAPGKGNTLLNYCGIRTDFLDYTVDRSPHKQGKFLPGTHIPIFAPERIAETKPDYVMIVPWNLQKEIATQLAYVRDWGGRLFVPIPEVRVL